MSKTPAADDVVLARRKAGYADVTIASDLPPFKGWQPYYATGKDNLIRLVWREGECIPMRYEEAEGRDDCEPVLDAPKET